MFAKYLIMSFLIFGSIPLIATECLDNKSLEWTFFANKCSGNAVGKAGHSYEVSKAAGGDAVYFYNKSNIPVVSGKKYQVTMKLSQCDATLTPKLMISFPEHQEMQVVSAPIDNGTADAVFTAPAGVAGIRIHLVVEGDGKAIINSVFLAGTANAGSSRQKIAVGAAHTKNLLGEGSGFEIGPHGMNPYCAYSWAWGWISPGIQPVFDNKVFYNGAYSLRLTAEDSTKVAMHEKHNKVWFMPIKLDPKKTYTLSAWMKSDRPGFLVDMGCGERIGNDTRVEVTTEWKRYSFTFKPEHFLVENYCRAVIGVAEPTQSGSLWIDNVQLEEGMSCSSYVPESLEFGAFIQKGDKLFNKKKLKDAAFTLQFRNNGATSIQCPIDYAICDYWGKEVAKGAVRTAIPSYSNRSCQVPIPALPCGYYRAHFDSRDKRHHDEAIFGIYEPMHYQGRLPADWPLGCHDSVGLPIIRDLGFGWVRSFQDFSMKHICPEKGVYNFKETDIVADRCTKSNLNLMPILGPAFNGNTGWDQAIPQWAIEKSIVSSVKTSWLKPVSFPSLEAWSLYVKALVSRYKDRIHTWEVMNEPDCWLTPDEYVPYLKAAYAAAKEADPNCVVIAGSTTSDFGKMPLPWTRRMLELDGYKSMDAISVHMYGCKMPERTLGGTENFLSFLKADLHEHGRNIPIWHTEKSYASPVLGYSRAKFNLPPSYFSSQGFQVRDFREKTEFLIREALIDSCVGNGPFFWYSDITSETYISAKAPSGFDPFWLWHTEYDGSPYPELLAANGLARMLENRSVPQELIKLGSSTYCALYSGPDGSMAALWDAKGGALLHLPKDFGEFKVFNLFGEPLTINTSSSLSLGTAPIYLQFDKVSPKTVKSKMLKCHNSGSAFSVSGGFEMDSGKLVFALYIHNDGIAGSDVELSISSIPPGWKFKVSDWHGTCNPGIYKRVVFTPAEKGIANCAQKFIFSVNGTPAAIEVPPFNSEELLTSCLSDSTKAYAYEIKNKIKIDGNLSEWTKDGICGTFTSTKVKLGRDTWKDASDLSCDARFRWNEEYLYLGMHVYDNALVREASASSAYLSDSIEFFIGLDPLAKEHKSIDVNAFGPCDFQILFAPGDPTGPFKTATAWSVMNNGPINILVASQVEPCGYTIEAAIPWKSLKAGFTPKKGAKMLMSFQTTDTDVRGVSASKKIFWAGDESNYSCPQNWGTLTLK